MDLISKSAIEITTLALDGLLARHKVLSSNIANAETPGYKRTDVKFEDQLDKIIVNEDAKQKEKEEYSRSLMYYPNSLSSAGQINMQDNFIDPNRITKTAYQKFNPEIIQSDANAKPNGNNVNIEHEMAQLSQNGMKYNALAHLQEKMFKGMLEAIKGGGA
ncbi:MAG: flagellar basal body protein [Candidatus Gastranaerophilales bacterium]|nr:flagellar basal body protein [Candidatus Gastranaerophilales bacterium]